MPFTFPDPTVTDIFTAANGVTYIWDDQDKKWVIKGYKSDLDDRYINSDGDTMDGPLVLKSPIVNDEHAATKIYVDDSIAAIPPVDLTGYATEQYVDDAIEDAVEVLDDKIDNLPPHVGQYVKKAGGDSMQGPLTVTGNRDPNADGVESTVIALNVDSGQSSSLNLKWKGGTKVYIGEHQTILAGDLKFNVGGRRIYAGNNEDKGFQVNDSGVFYDGAYTVDRHVATKKNVDDAIALIGGDKEGLFTWDASSTDLPVGTWQFEGRSNPSYTESGVQVVNIQKQDKNGLTFSDADFEVGGQIEIKNVSNDDYLLGTITSIVDGGPKSVQISFNRNSATGRATGDQTIKSVKEPLPYVHKGGDSMSGDLKMRDNAQIQFIDPVGSPTLIRAGRGDAEYPMILDLRHPGGSIKGGYDIKVQGNSSYNSLRFTNAKGPVFEVNGGGGAPFGSEFHMDTSLDGHRIVKLGEAVDDTDAVPYSQVKQEITDKFDSIDLSDYLKLDASNDPLTGNLWIETGADTAASLKLTGDRPNSNNSAATIAFENAKSANLGYITYRAYGASQWFTFNQDVDFGDHGLHSIARIRMQAGGVICSDANERLKFNNASAGAEGNGLLEVPRPSNARRGFAIRGNDTSNTQTDILYSYTNASGGDAVNYEGKMIGDTNLVNLGKVKELIASGGSDTGDGEAFQRHGPFHYVPGGGSVSNGEFTTDSTNPKQVRVFTFHRKNQNGENDEWSNLAKDEVITVGQGTGDAYFIINYTVTNIQNFTYSTIVDVDAHQTFVSYSDGSVVYNPNDAFDFLTDTPSYVLESQPATLNNAVDLSNKASPAPAFNSYTLDTGTAEPLLGIGRGKMIAAGTSNIQTATRFIFSANDKYGNGHKWGANSFDCPGSILELYRKNGEGSLCLCKVYEFSRVNAFGTNLKFEFRNLIEKHSATNNNTFIGSPGTLSPGAEYLVRYQFNFATAIYTVDEEGDPHYNNHRLEDVGHPVAATDAATKGYVDAIAGDNGGGSDLPTFKFASKEIEDLQTGQFVCFDSSNNITTELGRIRAIAWKGTDVNGRRPIRDDGAITWDGNLNSTFSLLISSGKKTVLRTSMSQIINGHPTISYLAAYDVYCIQWTGGDTTVMTSDFTRMTNSQSVSFHCSELFF